MSNPTPEQAAPSQSSGSVYRVPLTKVTSVIIMTQWRRATYTGTLEQLETTARGVRTHNLLAGWWGIPFGLIRTPMALASNAKAMRQVRELAAGKQ